MEESFQISNSIDRYSIYGELKFSLDVCLDFLEENNIKATFFIVAWIGKKFPEIIKCISDNGHEIASHALNHRRLDKLSNREIKSSLKKSKEILENISGQEVVGFRAPDFSLPQNIEILDYMYEIGYKYDSSMVFTNLHDVYQGPVKESNIFYFDNGLVEFPISNIIFFKLFSLPLGGGGYLRLYPTALTRYFIKKSKSPIIYLHPYELAGKFPEKVSMNPYRKFRHTYNIKNVAFKTKKIIEDFEPVSVKKYLQVSKYID